MSSELSTWAGAGAGSGSGARISSTGIGLACRTFCETQPSSDVCRRPWPCEPITIRSNAPERARSISAFAGGPSTSSVVTLTSSGSVSGRLAQQVGVVLDDLAARRRGAGGQQRGRRQLRDRGDQGQASALIARQGAGVRERRVGVRRAIDRHQDVAVDAAHRASPQAADDTPRDPGNVLVSRVVSEEIDQLDARLLLMLRAHPRVGVVEVARRLGVARGTVQARMDKLAARGVITGFGPDVEPARDGLSGARVRLAGDRPGPPRGGRRGPASGSPRCSRCTA